MQRTRAASIPHQRRAAKLLTHDEARRIAANIAKLPGVIASVDRRSREYLIDREVERLIEAAKQNRSGHRNAKNASHASKRRLI